LSINDKTRERFHCHTTQLPPTTADAGCQVMPALMSIAERLCNGCHLASQHGSSPFQSVARNSKEPVEWGLVAIRGQGCNELCQDSLGNPTSTSYQELQVAQHYVHKAVLLVINALLSSRFDCLLLDDGYTRREIGPWACHSVTTSSCATRKDSTIASSSEATCLAKGVHGSNCPTS